VATWAEFERADAQLAAFGRERLDGRVCFHATLRRDGSPRVHPVEPWVAAGFLMVRFRRQSPKVREVGRDARYALHSPMDNPDGVGGEFLVRGWMEQISPDHPAANRDRSSDADAARVLRALGGGSCRHDLRGHGSRPGLPALAFELSDHAT
jgi:hypothetical protein